jgi:nitrite reductase/ring-hydroxylating ferredoxin subunit
LTIDYILIISDLTISQKKSARRCGAIATGLNQGDAGMKIQDSMPLSYTGHGKQGYDPEYGKPDLILTQVGRGTPAGEYLRRFWHPVAYVHELEDVPLRIRILGENLVLFRDKSGRIGLLFLNCCHRGASLEFGILEERGIRCCYHGRVFDIDGTLLEIPGESASASDRIKQTVSQGAYPTHIFAGMIFAYMGPPVKKPQFPNYDAFEVPGIRLVPGSRLPFACNWVQIKDNAIDPAHTAVLHAIEAANQFSASFRHFPETYFARSPIGLLSVCARRVRNNVWVRTIDLIMPNIHLLSSIADDGLSAASYSPPWLSIWTTPVDDNNSINFLLSHMREGDNTPIERRKHLEDFGQSADRPYKERQKVPGDYDAMVSQGPTAIHDAEHLGANDAGIVLFRRALREGIEAVGRGEDPPYLFRTEGELLRTYVNNFAVELAQKPNESDERDQLREVCRQAVEDMLRSPPQLTR